MCAYTPKTWTAYGFLLTIASDYTLKPFAQNGSAQIGLHMYVVEREVWASLG